LVTDEATLTNIEDDDLVKEYQSLWKPLIANMSGYNLLHAHYGGFVVTDNTGPFIFLFFFCQFWLLGFVFRHG
jgi:hypothetical protein